MATLSDFFDTRDENSSKTTKVESQQNICLPFLSPCFSSLHVFEILNVE